jgi:hypothetical protein
MEQWFNTLKSFQLGSFYMSLPVELKEQWQQYSRDLPTKPPIHNESFYCDNAAQFLWTSAANAIPQKDYQLAQTLLYQALQLTDSKQDLAWIHANLTQLYYDQLEKLPDAEEKCRYHCQQAKSTGYFQDWCDQMINQI